MYSLIGSFSSFCLELDFLSDFCLHFLLVSNVLFFHVEINFWLEVVLNL